MVGSGVAVAVFVGCGVSVGSGVAVAVGSDVAVGRGVVVGADVALGSGVADGKFVAVAVEVGGTARVAGIVLQAAAMSTVLKITLKRSRDRMMSSMSLIESVHRARQQIWLNNRESSNVSIR